MAVLFQNSTTFKTNSGMSDHDIVQANNDLKRKKDKLRYTIGVSICLVWLMYKILTSGGMGYAGFMIQTFVGLLIGFVPAELVVRMVYGTKPAVNAAVSAPKIFKYTFTEDKIMVTADFETTNIPYSAIERVTQNPYSYFVYYMGSKYQIDKNGFSVDPREFEKLMLNEGKSMGVEYGNY